MEHLCKEKQRADNTKSASTELQGLSFPSRMLVHAKLEMSSPGDADETEADALASEVMKGGVIKRRISGGGTSSGITMPSRMSGFLSSTLGGGSSLPSGIRSKMETGFGLDFSNVRVHDNPAAAEASRSIGAQAFTYGNDIYFNQGKFSPGTEDGQKLIAHELAHVAQGNQYVHRQVDDTENMPVEQDAGEKQMTSMFPQQIQGLSDEAEAKLRQVARLIKKEVPKFKKFATGETLRKNGTDKQVNIPDIDPLIKGASAILMENDVKNPFTDWQREKRVSNDKYAPNGRKAFIGKHFEFKMPQRSTMLDKGGNYRIETTHPEVSKYLRNFVTAEEAQYVCLWARYYHIRGSILVNALGFADYSESDFVRHNYSLKTLSSFEAGKNITAGGGLGYEGSEFEISYWNNAGLTWKMTTSRHGVILSAGASAGSPTSSKEIVGECKSDVTDSDLWITPYDFINEASSNVMSAGVSGGIVAGAAAGKSFMTIGVKGKGTLFFDTSGLCSSEGMQAGIGASYSMNIAPAGMSSPEGFSASGTPTLDFPMRQHNHRIELCEVDRKLLYFETGSHQLNSKTYGADNLEKINEMIARLEKGIYISRKAGTFSGVEISIIGSASPMWKYKKNGETQNLELSQNRAAAAQMAIERMIGSFSTLDNMDSERLVSYTRKIKTDNFDSDLNVTAVGDSEAYEITQDRNNNDETFRSAEIVIYLKLAKVFDGIKELFWSYKL